MYKTPTDVYGWASDSYPVNAQLLNTHMESLIGAFYTHGFGSDDAQAISGCYTTLDISGAAVIDPVIVGARSCCIADAPLL